MKRAGDVVGVPAWQLDLMNGKRIEDLRNDIIPGQIFKGDPCFIESEFDKAKYEIGRAIDHLNTAYQYAEKYGWAEVIGNMIDRLDDGFLWDLDELLKKFKEGVAS